MEEVDRLSVLKLITNSLLKISSTTETREKSLAPKESEFDYFSLLPIS